MGASSMSKLGPFELRGVVGRGGFGEVWAAAHEDGTPVAVKIITAARLRQPRARASLANEVRAVAGLRHPGIVEVFDLGAVSAAEADTSSGKLVEGSPYLVTEFVGGGTLSSCPPRSQDELVADLLRILDTLGHAHARGLVHRDLKPSNVLRAAPEDRRPGLRISDWGIAHAVDSETHGAEEPEILGTLRYMAPEQIRGETREQGPWTDLYGLGCMAWRLATGQVPFEATTPTAIAQRQLRDPPPPLVPTFSLHRGFEAWLRRLLEKHPDDRFARAADAAEALRELVGLPDEDASDDWRPDPESAPVRLFRGAGLGLFGVRRIPVVGRDGQRDRMWSALQSVAGERRPRALVLEGEAGMGTSRLAAWLTHRASERGLASATRAPHGLAGDPGSGVVPMLARLLRVQGLPRDEVLVRVQRRLARHGVEGWEAVALTEIVSPATPAEVRGGAPTVRFTSADEQHDVVLRHLARESERVPRIVWLDAVQDALATVALVERALASELHAPLLFVLTTRPSGSAVDAAHALARGDHADRLPLGPLRTRDQRRLVQELLGLQGDLAEEIEQLTAGTPLFAVQLVGDLVQRGVLVAGPDGFELAPGAELLLPADVHVLLQARIDDALKGQRDTARTALELAAALGVGVDRSEWTMACRLADTVGPYEVLERLQDRHLLEATRTGWTFPHRSVRESLLRSARDRGSLQAVQTWCAEALLQAHPDGHPGIAERRARHLLAADGRDAAVEPMLAAADEDRKRGRPLAAMNSLDRLGHLLRDLGADDSDPRAAEAQLLRARIDGHLTDFEEARRRSGEVVERARRGGWDGLLPRALRTLAFALWHLGERDRAEEMYAEALPLFAAKERWRGVGRCDLGLGIAAAHRGDVESAEELFTGAVEAFGAAHDDRGLADAFGWLGILASRRGDRGRAMAWFERALPPAERVGHRLGVAMIRNSMAVVARLEGRADEAEEQFRKSVALAEAVGTGESVWPRINLALALLARRAVDEAEQHLERTLLELPSQGRAELGGLVHAALATCAAHRREWTGFDRSVAAAATLLRGASRIVAADLADVTGLAHELATAAGEDDRARAVAKLAEPR